MAQHPLARFSLAQRPNAKAWVADRLAGAQADDQLALLCITRVQCNTEAGSASLSEVAVRLMAGLPQGSTA